MADEKLIAEFRKKLIEDDAFRTAFADDPADALRSIGIDVPDGVDIPPVDKDELENRVNRIKLVLGNRVKDLYGTKSFGKLVKDRATFNKLEYISSLGNRIGSPFGRGGPVYTISAFGTIDW